MPNLYKKEFYPFKIYSNFLEAPWAKKADKNKHCKQEVVEGRFLSHAACCTWALVRRLTLTSQFE